jgi:hypothetical protein
VDACGHRDGEAEAGRLHQQSHRLQGVAHDESGLGVAPGLLVEAFDRRHLAPFLGALQPVGQHDDAAVDPHQAAPEQMQEASAPQLGQAVQIQRGGMKEVQQAVVAGIGKAQAADQTGHAGQVRAQAQGR